MSKLIEETPDVAMLIFNHCVSQDKYFTYRSYGETKVERRVSYSFFPFKRKHRKYQRSSYYMCVPEIEVNDREDQYRIALQVE